MYSKRSPYNMKWATWPVPGPGRLVMTHNWLLLNFSNGVKKQFGVASWADTKCGSMTGWYIPAAVLPWIKQNSNYGGGSGGSSSSSSSSNSYNRQTTHNQYQQNHQQNRHNQQRHTTSHNSHQSNSGSQSAQRVKRELQKLRSQFDQMLALL